jgi:type VI secretion system protein ImpC
LFVRQIDKRFSTHFVPNTAPVLEFAATAIPLPNKKMTESIQKKLLMVHPPRVRITYDVETGGTMERRELSFIVGIFADLSGERDPAAAPAFPPGLKDRRMVDIDRDNFNDVLRQAQPRLALANVDNLIAGSGKIAQPIVFESLADFDPARVMEKVNVTRAAFARRQLLRETPAHADATEAISEIDRVLIAQLSIILHDEAFRKLEATWRGLFYLVSKAETGTQLKLRVFNASLAELRDGFSQVTKFDQSDLFKLIYAAEFDTLRGAPYSLLVGGYEIGPGAADIAFLRDMAAACAAAHAPFITAASPTMFELDDFGHLGKVRSLAKIFEMSDFVAWNEFRDSEDARYVNLVLPHVLLRAPYGGRDSEKSSLGNDFHFAEQLYDAEGLPDRSCLLWGNAAYFLAERIANAFALYGWTAAIQGIEGGGLVEGLPVCEFRAGGEGVKGTRFSIDAAMTGQQEAELDDLGFIALCPQVDGGKAVFMDAHTSNRPKQYFSDDANANAVRSSRLPCMLAASRFAHYLKVIMREKMGSFLTRANIEVYLNTWIANYVLLDDNEPQEVRASYPLRAAQVVVAEVPGEPGAYTATVFLKPHFQLEELTTSIRLVVALPK